MTATSDRSTDQLPSAVRSLASSLRLGYRADPWLIVVAFATSVAAAVPDALFALGLAAFTDSVIGGDRTAVLMSALALSLLAACGWLLNTAAERVNRRFADRAGIVVESHVARLQSEVVTIEHHERPDFVDRLSLLRDHAPALSELYQQLFAVAGAVLRLGLTVALLMSVHPALGLLGVCAVPTVLVSTWRAGIEKSAEEAGAQHDRLARHLFVVGSTPAAGKELRVAGVRQRIRADRRAAWERRYRPMARARWATAIWQSASYAFFGIAFCVAVGFVAQRGDSPAGQVMLVLAAGSRLSQYVGQSVSQTHFFRTIWLDCARRLAWLEGYARTVEERADAPVPERLRAGISFENVSFTYPGTDRPVLKDVSFTIPAGAVVAVVGENGAGKSTLVKLLCQLYRPTSGRITVEGTDLSRIPAPGWRRRLSGAFQDFVKFEYPLRTSVGLGDLARAELPRAVEEAVTRAGADEVTAVLPRGIDTQLGATWPEGVELSQGQWQRVALARGFMRRSPLLTVLDEPTSAMDAETEHALFERYAEAARASSSSTVGGVTILVSHRFSTVQMADVIVVLDGARLVEHGSHEELVARGGQYAELYGIQAAGYR
ncbi:ABC transporter ATP-binding protein [Streptomyces pathocidini]|uniref:ABC transporter ATP-binding protein n=1 Tax=Streptomyces pathocidini TaxID=1650571 RepID=UPI0033F4FF77